jgi:hypothetical protein
MRFSWLRGSGGLLVPATLAAASGIPRTTLNRYLELLSAVFLIKQIPAWSAGQAQRAIGTPKLAFVDTGIASHLLGQDATRLGEPGGAAGPMIETLVLMELARQLTWCQERARLHHYRTKDKVEVDAILETPDGRVVAIEVKAGATVRSEDLAGLRHLAQRLGSGSRIRPLHRAANPPIRRPPARPSHRCLVELRTLTPDTGDRRWDGALRTQSLPWRRHAASKIVNSVAEWVSSRHVRRSNHSRFAYQSTPIQGPCPPRQSGCPEQRWPQQKLTSDRRSYGP